jgi:hypothetical protein
VAGVSSIEEKISAVVVLRDIEETQNKKRDADRDWFCEDKSAWWKVTVDPKLLCNLRFSGTGPMGVRGSTYWYLPAIASQATPNSRAVVARYKKRIQAGDVLFPLTVFYENDVLSLYDGFHRATAYHELNRHAPAYLGRRTDTFRIPTLFSIT